MGIFIFIQGFIMAGYSIYRIVDSTYNTYEPDLLRLFGQSDVYHEALYPGGPMTSLEELKKQDAAIFVLECESEIVGCAALIFNRYRYAEIKRVYIDPEFRGKKLSTALLSHLIRDAVVCGMDALYLEFGHKQPEAAALYKKFGFTECLAFGPWVGNESPYSIFLKLGIG
jgi:putative acetyltransferase